MTEVIKMNEFELKFYEIGIKDANENRSIVLPYQSKRYEKLSRKLGVKIGDKRGKSTKAYNAGVAFEINRQTKLEF
jgi:hypothetical protein